jgi:hypothetical protein
MRSVEGAYQNALREFKRQYVVWVLVRNACHLGRTARELGMHHNALTRTVRELGIDARQIRKEMRVHSTPSDASNLPLICPLHSEQGSLVPVDRHLHSNQIRA